MKCPACQKRACSFLEWMKGRAIITPVCPHCGQALRASRRTWVVLSVMFASIPFVIYAAETICRRYGIVDDGPRRGVFALLWTAVVAAFSFIEWRTGKYRA